MLVRSAGRRHQRRTARLLATSFAELQLPWLAPAQLRWNASQAGVKTPSSSNRTRQNNHQSSSLPSRNRGIATASDSHFHEPSDALLPPPGYSQDLSASQFNGIPNSATSEFRKSLYLRPYHDPIVINTTVRSPEDLIKVQNGIHGTAKDLLALFQTSIIVGRKERAEAIAHRLAEACGPNSPQMIYAHHAYLGEMLRSLAAVPGDSLRANTILSDMQKWFDTEIIAKNIPVTGKMLVIMSRAVIRCLEGNRLHNTLRHYAELGGQVSDAVLEEMVSSEEYDDHEYTVVGRATSDFYEEVEDEPLLPPLDASEQISSEQAINTYNPDIVNSKTPEVRPTPQKGSGLEYVKRVMSALDNAAPIVPGAVEEDRLAHAREREYILEQSAADVAIERWRQEGDKLRRVGVNTAMMSKPLGALMWQWYEALLPLVQQEVEACRAALAEPNAAASDRLLYGPYLELLKPETVAANVLLTAMSTYVGGKEANGGDAYGFDVKIFTLTIRIAVAIEAEYKTMKSAAVAARARKLRRQSALRGSRRVIIRSAKNAEAAAVDPTESTLKEPPAVDASPEDWPAQVRVKLGAALLAKLLECAMLPVTREHPRTGEKVTQMQPAFLHRVKYMKGKKLGVVVPNSELIEKMRKEPLASVVAKRMPMLVEPRPWAGWKDGGYLNYPTSIMRIPKGDKSGREYFIAAHREGDLDTLCKGLTALGKVSWMINEDVFRVQLEAWNSGEAIANFAPLNPVFDMPPEPETDDAEKRRAWLDACRALENRRIGYHSQRCFQNFQMEIARSLLGERLYFPHNLDFRGRAYPIPPYLNHMGADNVRAMMTFAEGKPLGASGLRWLKIHTATVAGYDKASMDDRLRFTEEHLDDIFDSATNPLDGRRWWLKAEDAWQTLAACFELKRALESPNPEEFISHLPIQQDGTCNGLQHYAALGGDPVGARQVNLEPSDKPADVYTAVAEHVKEQVAKDAAAGHPIALKLDGHITRKWVKQPVMTNVYGVTMFGARQQVLRQLEGYFKNASAMDDIKLFQMATYITDKIFRCFGSMFTGAQAIQDWLGTCAARISTALTPEQVEQMIEQARIASEVKPTKKKFSRTVKEPEPSKKPNVFKAAPAQPNLSNNRSQDAIMAKKSKEHFKSTVVWTTPLGLPVVQPYRATASKQIKTSMQMMSINEPQVWDPVNKRKQLQAFPPNFIHSLDSTHMLLSALKFDEMGKTFASVHDSFWTHACDIDTLSEVLRDAFISMHSEDVIARLREEFETRYKGCFHLVAIDRQSPAGKKLDSYRTARGLDKPNDLFIEAERLRLLSSANPEERAKGEAMVTMASLVQEARREAAAEAAAQAENADVADELATSASDIAKDEPKSRTLGGGGSVSDAQLLDKDIEIVSDPYETGIAQTKADADDAAAAGVMDEAEADAAAAEQDQIEDADAKKPTKSKRSKNTGAMYVWLPIEFPPVPKRGSFDVTKIQQSKYFFH